jgi:hypothetical protein
MLRRKVIVLSSACAVALLVSGVSLSATAYFLDIPTVTCWSHNDPDDSDDPYLKLNDDRIWTGPECTPVTTMYPNLRTSFWDHADVYIMDDDFGFDDTVGQVYVTGALQGQGQQYYYSYLWYDGIGWLPNYEMEYSVPA